MLTPCLEDQPIFRLEHAFHQTHVILLSEWTQGDDGTHDRSGLDTHEYSGMNAAGNWDAILRDYVEFHGMLIDLGPLASARNGKGNRNWKTPFPSHTSLLT